MAATRMVSRRAGLLCARYSRRTALTSPDVKFSFSPALRADINPNEIPRYWPGDALVDVMGGTWYVGPSSDFGMALSCEAAYHAFGSQKGLPFGLDEIGGITRQIDPHHGRGQDQMLSRMFSALDEKGFVYDYVTVFLDGKWGNPLNDVTLAWATPALAGVD